MKKYKSIKIEFENGKITGYSPSSEKPDMVTIFPWFPPPQELFDKYGNYQNEVSVTVKEVDGQTVTECKPILKPMRPTDEQIEKYKKRRYVEEIRKTYSIDDEIALVKDKIKGKSDEFDQMELVRQEAKERVRMEVESDLNAVNRE